MARVLVETTKMVSSKGYIDVPDYISKEELREYVWKNYNDIHFTDESVVDDSETIEGLDYELSEALEMAKMHFETGVSFKENDFSDDSLLDGLTEYERYCEYLEYGPAGFYEEFKDILDFDEDFIAEYGDEFEFEDIDDIFYFIENKTDWSVKEYYDEGENNDELDIYLCNHSPLGEDITFEIDIPNYKNKTNSEIFQEILVGIRCEYDNFDVDEHAEMWINNRGKNGVPKSTVDLVNDAKDIKGELKNLYETLEKEGENISFK